jgi:hypothetical protein
MSLVGPWLSTTSTKKRSEKITKSKQEELERGWRDRNQRLKDMHLPKETFEQYMEFVYGHSKKEKRQTPIHSTFSKTPSEKITKGKLAKPVVNDCFSGPTSTREVDNDIPSLDVWITGPCSSKPSPTYTGTKMIGIAVLHKSCLQPVFSSEEATEIARMRR